MTVQILLTSLWIWGVHASTTDRMIFARVARIKLPDWITFPIYECPICMSSFHGLLLAVLWFGFPMHIHELMGFKIIIPEIVLVIPCVAGLNYILDRMFRQ